MQEQLRSFSILSINTVKGGLKRAASPRKNGQRLAFRNLASRRLSVYSNEPLGLRLVPSKHSYPFQRGRDCPVLNPALGKSRLSDCHSAWRRTRFFAPSASSFRRCIFATLLFRSKASVALRASFSLTLGALPPRAPCFAKSGRRRQGLERRQVAAPEGVRQPN
jgi:hypothetical protein